MGAAALIGSEREPAAIEACLAEIGRGPSALVLSDEGGLEGVAAR